MKTPITLLVLSLFFTSCSERTKSERFENVKEVSKASWSSLDSDLWPQLVLTNEAEFVGHTPLYGASSFLIESRRGDIFGVTARHLLGENGGVEPEVTLENLNTVLKNWVMYPRTQEAKTVSLSGTKENYLEDENDDLLLLELNDKQDSLPATPLKIRETPIKVGEKVFLIGVPYSDAKSSQNVYVGEVIERKHGDRFRYSITPSVDIRGFSGAPIVDKNGMLVGLMTIWFNPMMDGELYTEAGGEDVIRLRSIIEN